MEKNEPSTATGDSMEIGTPSTNYLVETENSNESTSSPALPAISYPSGIKLSLVVVALMLAMFLVALDMVSCPHL